MLELKKLTKRVGQINPLSLQSALSMGAYKAFKKALKTDRIDLFSEIEASKLRGRGGAGFPVHIKMMAIAKETEETKYLVCNADEGEPGNFKDRYLLEKDPHLVLEGVLISAYIARTTKGYIYIRGEYNQAIAIMSWALEELRSANLLGKSILGSDMDFDLEIRRGAGSYVVGEEFAMLESIEGKAGRTRVKPPFPTEKGLFGKPTLINNVETFANLPMILEEGGVAFSKIGTPTSTGTKLISLSGNVLYPGVYETPFGVSLRDVIETLGGGVGPNRHIKMVQLGGACGPIIPEMMLDMKIDFDRFEDFESKTGAGAIIVMDDRQDLFQVLSRIVAFFNHESCGRCTPCREGHEHVGLLMKKFLRSEGTPEDLYSLESLARVMHHTSLCGLGQSSPVSILSSLGYFRDEYHERMTMTGGRHHG